MNGLFKDGWQGMWIKFVLHRMQSKEFSVYVCVCLEVGGCGRVTPLCVWRGGQGEEGVAMAMLTHECHHRPVSQWTRLQSWR